MFDFNSSTSTSQQTNRKPKLQSRQRIFIIEGWLLLQSSSKKIGSACWHIPCQHEGHPRPSSWLRPCRTIYQHVYKERLVMINTFYSSVLNHAAVDALSHPIRVFSLLHIANTVNVGMNKKTASCPMQFQQVHAHCICTILTRDEKIHTLNIYIRTFTRSRVQ